MDDVTGNSRDPLGMLLLGHRLSESRNGTDQVNCPALSLSLFVRPRKIVLTVLVLCFSVFCRLISNLDK